jgi:hypothetical protein
VSDKFSSWLRYAVALVVVSGTTVPFDSAVISMIACTGQSNNARLTAS